MIFRLMYRSRGCLKPKVSGARVPMKKPMTYVSYHTPPMFS
jgi:hypothetical protein